MKTSAKQIFFVISGILVTTAVFLLIQFNTASAAKQHGKKFGDWQVTCEKPEEKSTTPKICALSQQVDMLQDDKKQPIALFQIGYFGPQKELRLIQILPLGVNIQAGTSIINSKSLIAPGKYTTCLNNGCTAVTLISETDLKKILSSQENSVAFMNLESKQVTLPLSTKGLEQGLKYIK